jgi:hypothetical protein
LNELLVLVHTADKKIYIPAVLDGMALETHRKGQPGKLTFKAIQDELLTMEEGSIVQVKRGDMNIFQGVVFSRSLDKDNIVSVVAYDQLRYLKNKHVYSAVGKKASEIIRQLAEDFSLTCGEIADTEYVIPRFRAGEQTLFDMMQTAIDITTEAQKKLFILYDDYGKLMLKNMEDMRVDILIDAETAEDFSYKSDIDKDTYNRIKLYFDNKETGQRDVWLVQDSDTMSKWGVLQLTQSVNPKKATSLPDKAQAMLKRYNRVRKTLSIQNALGDDRVRGGSSLYVNLLIDKQQVTMKMLVESVCHKYANGEHFMDLTLRGGMFE